MNAQRAEKYLDMAQDNVNDCKRDVDNCPAASQDFYRKRLCNANVVLNRQMEKAEDAKSAIRIEKIQAYRKVKFINERTKK